MFEEWGGECVGGGGGHGDCFGGGWWTGMIARFEAANFFRSNFKNFRIDYLFSVDFPTTTDDGRPRCWSKLFCYRRSTI